MNVLNTISNTWTTLSITGNLLIQCGQYTANIVYIGGVEKVSTNTNYTPVDINQVKLNSLIQVNLIGHMLMPLVIKLTQDGIYFRVNKFSTVYLWTANLYNDYMIITFGIEIDTQLYSSQVYLYNIKSNKWVTTYSPPTTTGTSTASINPVITSPPAKKSSKNLAIGLGTGIGVAVLVFCIFIAIFVFRRIRHQHPDLEIPDSRNQ
ncbi:hypothetical protein Glove_461g27 [Diversispora epigaea]|uniref:Uncharacterized protein n=1 Tax=Diversispora epigaea TaxID=1348612 RepID=A0A397GN10_9GLOM|nr:hypothetical protein Glove_461g27 [Diversispora epigaea]